MEIHVSVNQWIDRYVKIFKPYILKMNVNSEY